jgi:hypothetical protein
LRLGRKTEQEAKRGFLVFSLQCCHSKEISVYFELEVIKVEKGGSNFKSKRTDLCDFLQMKKFAKLHWFALFTLAFTLRSCISFLPSESRIRRGFITRSFPRSNLFEIPDGSNKRFEILDCSSENDGLSAFEQKASKQKKTSDLTVQKILRFAIPAVGIWLCNPLLSIIDTSSVGLMAGTIQQAALNPAVAVTDYSARCMVC